MQYFFIRSSQSGQLWVILLTNLFILAFNIFVPTILFWLAWNWFLFGIFESIVSTIKG